MKIQSTTNAPVYAPYITKNRTTGELEWGQYNLTEFMEQARVRHDERLRELSAAKKSLTPAEIHELAGQLYQKYDPQHMTLDEYDSFINDLISSGVLNHAEIGGMGVGNRVIVDPCEPTFSRAVRSPLDWVSKLADTNGDVMLFLHALQDRDRGSAQSTEAHTRAVRKALAVLDAMLERRKQSEESQPIRQ